MWYFPSDARKGRVAALSGRTVIAVNASGTRIPVAPVAVAGAVGAVDAVGAGVAGPGEHPTRTIPAARTDAALTRCRMVGFARLVLMPLLRSRSRNRGPGVGGVGGRGRLITGSRAVRWGTMDNGPPSNEPQPGVSRGHDSRQL